MEETEDNRRERRGAAAQPQWHQIAESAEFRRLEGTRRRAVIALLGLFTIVFGTFLVLCGYARPFMRKSVDGGLTVAYVWLLALTVFGWIIVVLYLRFSERRLAPLARDIAEHPGAGGADRGRVP